MVQLERNRSDTNGCLKPFPNVDYGVWLGCAREDEGVSLWQQRLVLVIRPTLGISHFPWISMSRGVLRPTCGRAMKGLATLTGDQIPYSGK